MTAGMAGIAQGHAHGDRQRIETLENELAVLKNEQTQSSHGKFLPCSPPSQGSSRVVFHIWEHSWWPTAQLKRHSWNNNPKAILTWRTCT